MPKGVGDFECRLIEPGVAILNFPVPKDDEETSDGGQFSPCSDEVQGSGDHSPFTSNTSGTTICEESERLICEGSQSSTLQLLNCPICFEPPVEATVLSCGHAFCRDCIDQWTEFRNKCPLCNERVKSKTRVYILDELVEKSASSPELRNRITKAAKMRLTKTRKSRLRRIFKPITSTYRYMDQKEVSQLCITFSNWCYDVVYGMRRLLPVNGPIFMVAIGMFLLGLASCRSDQILHFFNYMTSAVSCYNSVELKGMSDFACQEFKKFNSKAHQDFGYYDTEKIQEQTPGIITWLNDILAHFSL